MSLFQRPTMYNPYRQTVSQPEAVTVQQPPAQVVTTSTPPPAAQSQYAEFDPEAFFARYAPGTTITEEQLNALRGSPLEVSQINFGDSLEFWDPKGGGGGTQLLFQPIMDRASRSDLVRPTVEGESEDTSGLEGWTVVNGADGEAPRYERATGQYKVLRPEYHSDLAAYLTDAATPERDMFETLAPIALSFIPGIGQVASGVLSGAVGAASSGGNPLIGALLGGLGGYAGGEIAGSTFAKANPIAGRALSSGARALISSGGNTDAALSSAMTGGLTSYLSSALPANLRDAASPLASAATQLATRGKVNPATLLQQWAASASRPQGTPK